MRISITKQAAREFLLHKQLLFPPMSLHGKGAVEEVFRTLRVVQYDPLNPCGRNTDLVLQARIADYHPDGYYRWLYTERKGVECYDKELCIVPIEDFPFTHLRRIKAQNHALMGPFFSKHRVELEALISRIDTDGPISSADIKDLRRVDIYWSEEQWGRAALETLWKRGHLAISHRKNGKKYYDLPHKIYGSAYTDISLHASVLGKEHIIRRLRGVGLLPKSGAGGGWQGVRSGRDMAALIKTLITEEQLVEVKVKGSTQVYVISTGDLQLLKGIAKIRPRVKRMVFLAPLDNVLWDRDMIRDLFGFDYTWEVYTPLSKRKYGYYVLPILYGSSLIGRIEPVLNGNRLVIKNIWLEHATVWNSKKSDALRSALDAFRRYLRAQTIITTAVVDKLL